MSKVGSCAKCSVCGKKIAYWNKSKLCYKCYSKKWRKDKKHKHILYQPNGVLDMSLLQCEKCALTFYWDIFKQKYVEVRV